VSGDLTVTDVSGDCGMTTVSGDVHARHISGSLTVRTTSGDVRLTDSQLDHFNLNSVSGDFTIETPLTPGQHYLARTVSGDLKVLVPPGTGATIQMKSMSGDVISELPAEIIKAGRRHWQGRINGGGANVEMNSVSGDLRFAHSGISGAPNPPSGSAPETGGFEGSPAVQSSSAETAAGDAPSSPVVADTPNAQDETNAILKALEQGEISVEEAMEKLDALR
jgi:DUF4097 and DUF4098 domain-containing protein YvlB